MKSIGLGSVRKKYELVGFNRAARSREQDLSPGSGIAPDRHHKRGHFQYCAVCMYGAHTSNVPHRTYMSGAAYRYFYIGDFQSYIPLLGLSKRISERMPRRIERFRAMNVSFGVYIHTVQYIHTYAVPAPCLPKYRPRTCTVPAHYLHNNTPYRLSAGAISQCVQPSRPDVLFIMRPSWRALCLAAIS